MRRLSAILLVVLGLVVGLVAPSAGAATTYPRSMASTGDSITRGFDATWGGCFLTDCPKYSWSTGVSVSSHYARLVALNPAISGHGYNDAKTGATMKALGRQLSSAASQGADYVTVLMGANDLCTSSASTMTPTATFTRELKSALGQFVAARPKAKVFVSSIPNIYQLWSVLHTDVTAQLTWNTFGICPSMLAATNNESQRQLVVARESELNGALATVCAQYVQCRWDGYATYDTQFSASDISTVDYFHPSIQGQNRLAAVTWAASYWG